MSLEPGPPAGARTARVRFPLYLVSIRRRHRQPMGRLRLIDLVPLVLDLPAPDAPSGPLRACVAAFRTRPSAAAWVSHQETPLRPYGVSGHGALDKVAAVTLGSLKRRWLALEPTPAGDAARDYVDLRAWLVQRRPWSAALERFCADHALGALPQLAYADGAR